MGLGTSGRASSLRGREQGFLQHALPLGNPGYADYDVRLSDVTVL
jgi:hypothetical protein